MNLHGKTVYLSGAMSGYEDYNFPAFHTAASKLRELGVEVISPAEIEDLEDYPDDVNEWEYAGMLVRDLQLIAGTDRGLHTYRPPRPVDAIVVLPGWEDSPGARAEVAFGRALKIPIVQYPGLLEVSGEWVLVTLQDTIPHPGFEPYILVDEGATKPVKFSSPRVEVLMEAAELVSGDRNKSYGEPYDDFSRTAAMWSAYKGVEFAPHDVGVMMNLLKCSRIAESPKKHDHWRDGCGYLACGLDCVEHESGSE